MNDFNWLNEHSVTFLERGYLLEGQTAKQRIRYMADYAERILNIEGFADRFYDNMSRGWYSLSSPTWANFGLDRGLPISCFGSYIDDTMESIMYTIAEVGMMNKYGGGTSAYFGKLRGRGSEIKDNGVSSGSFSFAKPFDTIVDTVSQGSTRRGQFAGYIDVEHPDILEWLEIQLEGNPIQLMYYGISIGDDWMKEMIDGDSAKRTVWAKILQCRSEIGIPYLFFRDNANKGKPQVYKDKDCDILASNLCTEIMLPSNATESFVCCLASMNLLHFDEWEDTDAVEVMIMFLDAVMSDFIEKTEGVQFMERAHKFAKRHRALGLGALGWHSLLQKKRAAFDSFEAMQLNAQIFRTIQKQSYAASEKLAVLLGEPEMLKGYGRRNTTTMSIAPTKSSSFILGQVSPTLEAYKSNYFVMDLAKSKVTFRNPELERLLEEKGMNKDEVWNSILLYDGSVQHLDCLSQQEKNVFKTSSEISQLAVVQQAAQRQKFIDQGQSTNLTIHPDTPIKDINQLHIKAWELGVKSLYYQNSVNASQKFNRDLLTCASCEA